MGWKGILGFDYGIVQAPLGPDISGPELVAAVADAGGLGFLRAPDWVSLLHRFFILFYFILFLFLSYSFIYWFVLQIVTLNKLKSKLNHFQPSFYDYHEK